MKIIFAKLMRRLIQSQLKKTSHEKLFKVSEKKLFCAFKRAAEKSTAYRELLAEHGVSIVSVRTIQEFVKQCPVLDKANTFSRFSLNQLIADDVPVSKIASVLTSSGHGSGGFALGLSTRDQMAATPSLIDLGLEMAFEIDQYRTLLINCLPMGVTFQSNAVCVANVSVREDMACAIVEQAGQLFDQIVLCGDPLFLKKLCDYSQEKKLDWSRFRMNVVIGEETFSETFRDYLAKVLHISVDDANSGVIISSMGVGELGLNLFTETRETIALRRACINNPILLGELFGSENINGTVPTFFIYSPLRTYVEINNVNAQGIGDLLVSVVDSATPIPLLRYKTGDTGKLISALQFERAIQKSGLKLDQPLLPLMALFGRSKDILPRGGHVDQYKQALYKYPDLAQYFSGAFRLSENSDGLLWEIQLVRDCEVDTGQLIAALESAFETNEQRPLIACHSYDKFPHGKTLDYERKFIYWNG